MPRSPERPPNASEAHLEFEGFSAHLGVVPPTLGTYGLDEKFFLQALSMRAQNVRSIHCQIW
uniref:Uncharacterized protein n=1 Tax=Arion vulgaris TaxID=1028688 RepID=A0A0B7AWX0_9EUPU